MKTEVFKSIEVLIREEISVEVEKKIVPFAVMFSEVAESSAVLKKGLEMYDDPTTVEATGNRPDAHTDEG